MIIPASMRALMAIYIIICATEGLMNSKKSGAEMGGKVGAVSAYILFVSISILLILDFIASNFNVYDFFRFGGIDLFANKSESGYSVLAYCGIFAATHKNWGDKKLTFLDYAKLGLGFLGMYLAVINIV